MTTWRGGAAGLAVAAGLTLAATAPAHATSGKMTYDEWQDVFKGQTNGSVDAFSGATGDQRPDGDGLPWTRLKYYVGGACGCDEAWVEYGDKDGDFIWQARWKEYRDPIGRLLDSVYWYPRYP